MSYPEVYPTDRDWELHNMIPTSEMMHAGYERLQQPDLRGHPINCYECGEIFKAMLSAAPVAQNNNTVSAKHPHEPEIPPCLDSEGRCMVCVILSNLHAAESRLAAIESAEMPGEPEITDGEVALADMLEYTDALRSFALKCAGDAARYRTVQRLIRVGTDAATGDSLLRMELYCEGVNLFKGSIVGHLDIAIDAAMQSDKREG